MVVRNEVCRRILEKIFDEGIPLEDERLMFNCSGEKKRDSLDSTSSISVTTPYSTDYVGTKNPNTGEPSKYQPLLYMVSQNFVCNSSLWVLPSRFGRVTKD